MKLKSLAIQARWREPGYRVRAAFHGQRGKVELLIDDELGDRIMAAVLNQIVLAMNKAGVDLAPATNPQVQQLLLAGSGHVIRAEAAPEAQQIEHKPEKT